MYPPEITQPCRKELTDMGVAELRSPEEVEKTLAQGGTTLVVVNSVCGCAAGSARPAVKLALQHAKLPERITSVFAGVDTDATTAARRHFKGKFPTSPSIALLKDGELVFYMERGDIEGRGPDQIARDLTDAFDQHC